jgi:glycosyltransferase involved in cell wall biosynthesis
MIISIVTGTFNRLKNLRSMIESVRKSLPQNWISDNINYEIIVVDGGSTDGTPQWCESQNDIHFIQQGELKGAISAFMEGAANAMGDYLAILNDDITVIGYTLSRGLSYIMDNRDVGCICFYQNRAGKEFHCENIQIERNGEMNNEPYMQCGIIPRWLWNHVGGWEWPGGHTYGGDVAMTAKVYRTGYKVVSLPECKIHDFTLNDSLRERNRTIHVNGPKFWEWCGKIINPPNELTIQNLLDTKCRVLYAPIIEKGHNIQKLQKRGLRDAFSEESNTLVWEVDYKYSGESIADAAEAWEPHITLTQIHTENDINMMDVGRIKRATKKYLFNWCGDVYEDQQLTAGFMQRLRLYDFHFVVNANLIERYKKIGINCAYWQNSFENLIIGEDVESTCDIVFIGNNYSGYREELATKLKSLPYKVHIYGRGYPEGIAEGESLYDFKKTGAIYRGAKLIIADNQYISAVGFASDRIFMALAAGGGMLLHQKVEGMAEWIGFKDREHYYSWDNFETLKKAIEVFMTPEMEEHVKDIAKSGTHECRSNHTYSDRLNQLKKITSSVIKRKTTISGMMIVKNEEDNIFNRLSELDQFCDEIIIVDTGSEDDTITIVEQFNGRLTPRLLKYEWNDDFAAARNFAKQNCSADWIFWVDGDDEITPLAIERLKRFGDWKSHSTEFPGAYRFMCKGKSSTCMQTRIFKNIDKIEWRGTIHELLTPSLEEFGIQEVVHPTIIIKHNSSGSHLERNIRILKKQDDSWLKFYQMASAYAGGENFALAFLYAEQSLFCEDIPKNSHDFLQYFCGYLLLGCGQTIKAMSFISNNQYPDAIYLKAVYNKVIDEKIRLLELFMKTEMPLSSHTKWIEYRKEAASFLIDEYNKKIISFRSEYPEMVKDG